MSSAASLAIVVWLLAEIGLTIAVAIDASARRMRAGAWAAGVLLLVVPILPLYLYARRAHPRPAPAPTADRKSMSARNALIGGLVGLLVVLYLSGRLDRELYKVGLNYTACGQNGFGAVFCGDDLKAYNQNISDAQQKAAAAEQAAQRQLSSYEQQQALCAADPSASGC